MDLSVEDLQRTNDAYTSGGELESSVKGMITRPLSPQLSVFVFATEYSEVLRSRPSNTEERN